jgi:hypothetical protein
MLYPDDTLQILVLNHTLGSTHTIHGRDGYSIAHPIDCRYPKCLCWFPSPLAIRRSLRPLAFCLFLNSGTSSCKYLSPRIYEDTLNPCVVQHHLRDLLGTAPPFIGGAVTRGIPGHQHHLAVPKYLHA